jgi:hypothetical protein
VGLAIKRNSHDILNKYLKIDFGRKTAWDIGQKDGSWSFNPCDWKR